MLKKALARSETSQQIIRAYRDAKQPWPTNTHKIAIWAYQHGLWRPSARDAVRFLTRDLGRAFRDETFIDPQGRRVRKNHAVADSIEGPDGEMKQGRVWNTFEEIEPKKMHASLQNRRGQILGDCHQLKMDADSYNDNRGADINLSYDFTEDLFEMEQPTDYQGETKPEGPTE